MENSQSGDVWGGAQTFLEGRVAVRQLPLFAKPPGPEEAASLKRLALPQGELAQFWNSAAGLRYLAGLEIVPGAVRGNHYHRVKDEVVYVFRGRMLLAFVDPHAQAETTVPGSPAAGQLQTVELGTGSLARVAPGVAHAYKGLEAGLGVEGAFSVFDAGDLVRHKVI